MGKYADAIKAQHSNLTPEQIRRNKNERTKQRNAIRKDERRQEAEERPQFSPAEQLIRLDKRLGKGVGAKKERRRLLSMIKEVA